MGTMDTNTTSLATAWRFRDGTEYVISMGLNEKPKCLSLSLADKVTAEEWSGQFDLTYIENLTQRTGNYKPFDTFATMIKCAILKKSDSVTLELMSYEDLLALRNQKKRVGGMLSNNNNRSSCTNNAIKDLNVGPNLGKFEVSQPPEIGPSATGSTHPNKYLIITYVAEFDKVHYPLPLKYTGYPDAIVMQQTIQKLKSEVSTLKSTNTDLISQLRHAVKSNTNYAHRGKRDSAQNELEFPVRNEDLPLTDTSDSDSELIGMDYDVNNPGAVGVSAAKDDERKEHEAKKLLLLGAVVKKLESRLEQERSDHHEKLTKLEAENEYLRSKIKSVEDSEFVLKEKVTRLESVLALNVGVKRSKTNNVGQAERDLTPRHSFTKNTPPISLHSRHDRVLRRSHTARNAARNHSSSSRCSSLESKGSKLNLLADLRLTGSNTGLNAPAGTLDSPIRSRPTSCERKTFNPTEYIRQKKEKQERLAQLRVARLERRLKGSDETENGGRYLSAKAHNPNMSPAESLASTALKSDKNGTVGTSTSSFPSKLQRQPSLESQRSFKESTNAFPANPALHQRSSLSPTSKHSHRPQIDLSITDNKGRQSRKSARISPKRPSVEALLLSSRKNVYRKEGFGRHKRELRGKKSDTNTNSNNFRSVKKVDSSKTNRFH